MNKVGPNRLSESGITLVALLVTIILIVILASVTIRSITGKERNIKHSKYSRKRL